MVNVHFLSSELTSLRIWPLRSHRHVKCYVFIFMTQMLMSTVHEKNVNILQLKNKTAF